MPSAYQPVTPDTTYCAAVNCARREFYRVNPNGTRHPQGWCRLHYKMFVPRSQYTKQELVDEILNTNVSPHEVKQRLGVTPGHIADTLRPTHPELAREYKNAQRKLDRANRTQ